MRTNYVEAKLRCPSRGCGCFPGLLCCDPKILQDVIDRRLTKRLAATRLEISDRHCRRLFERYREHGPLSLVNRRRGRPRNHRLPESLKLRVLLLLHDHYSDFGPTLAAEKMPYTRLVLKKPAPGYLCITSQRAYHAASDYDYSLLPPESHR